MRESLDPTHLQPVSDAMLAGELDSSRSAFAALSADYERLKEMADNAPVLLAYCDCDHRYRYVNAAYSIRYGAEPAELVGKSVAELLGPELWGRIAAYREKVLTGQPVEYEVAVERSPGTIQHMRCALNPTHDADGRVVGYVAAITDVTADKRVAEVRDLLAAIVDSSEDAIISRTLDGRITSWNEAAERLFGYTASEIVGKTLLPSELYEEEAVILERLRNGERISRYETVRYAKDGRCINVSLSAAPMRDHNGQIVGAAKVARDITESKQAEAALRRSEEALRESDRRKDEFLSVLAHELRNPLAPLANALEVIRRSASKDPDLQRLRDMMDRQLNQLVRIVDDLLDVSRISRGRLELRRERLSLAVAVQSALESCQSLFYTRGQEITLDLASEPLHVDGDFARLAQVFVNLLSNSAKYTERGGHIRVSLERHGEQAVVKVRDNGIGIPRESLATVFDMFSQIQSHKPLAEGGLGIGLALVRSLVQMHGGSVEADSDGPGTGSVFTVRLPIVTAGPVDDIAALASNPETGPERRRRILVADDNTDAAKSLAMLLQMQGHETCTAADGRQAVELAASFQPEIIFMDLGMPRVDGLEATRQIRAQPWGRSILIVALTGWGQQHDRHRTRQVGMDIHLVKPISMDGIAAVLAR